jgi:serine protease Do
MTRLFVAIAALVVVATPAIAATSARRTPVVEAVEKVGPAVVNIFTQRLVEDPFSRGRWPGMDPLFQEFFPDFFSTPGARPPQRQSLGSGVIVQPGGIVVTNEHVILRASDIRVLMADKSEFRAELVGSDSDSDLAVLKIVSEKALPYVELPSARDVLIGETVIAIGNPYGLSHTVTTGVVSAIGRTIQAGNLVYRDFIQTDASINPGNSGGPLLNVEGKLIGINTAIHREGEGIGFAIPASHVRPIVEQLLHHGTVQPAWIGLQTQDLTSELAFHFGVEPGTGIITSGVDVDSPAQKAGLARGAIILRVAGERVRSSRDFAARTEGLAVGETIEIDYVRDGETRSVVLRVEPIPPEKLDAFAWSAIGVAVEPSPRGNGPPVVSRVRESSPAAKIGIARGDQIVAVGGDEIADPDDFRRRCAGLRNKNSVLLTVGRGRRLYRVTVPLDRRS